MQTALTLTRKAAAVFLPVMLAACASEQPTVVAPPAAALSADQILTQSQGMAHLSERMKAGEQMIEQGNVMVRDGQTKIDEGNRMIDQGRKIKQEAEDSYRNIKN